MRLIPWTIQRVGWPAFALFITALALPALPQADQVHPVEPVPQADQAAQEPGLASLLATIESGEAARDALLKAWRLDPLQAREAIGIAPGLPVDWTDILALEGLGDELALRVAHEGLEADYDWAGLRSIPGWSELPLERCALLASGLLAPPASPPRALVAFIVEALLSEADLDHEEVLIQRVRAYLQSEDLERIVAALIEGTAASEFRAGSLMLAAPSSMAQAHLERLVVHDEVDLDQRIRAANRIVAFQGRQGLKVLRPMLDGQAPDELVRTTLILWQRYFQPEDLDLFQSLAEKDSERSGRFLALQMWARHETDAGQRERIFELGLEAPTRYVLPTMESLIRRGAHEGIAARLLDQVQEAGRQKRRMALALLPAFGGPEQLMQAFERYQSPDMPPDERAMWAGLIVGLPLQDAQQVAAQWLVQGGWREAREARVVAVKLEQSAAIDPYLDGFLREEEAPFDMRFRLAEARAEHVEEARAFLRSALEGPRSLYQVRAVRALGKAGQIRDLQRMGELLQDGSTHPSARAAAVEGLAVRPEGRALLLQFLDASEMEYEVAEGLVHQLVLRGSPEVRAQALQAVERGLGFSSSDERRGLRVAAWQAQASRPRPEEVERLTQEWLQLLALQPRETEPPRSLPEPRRLGTDFVELGSCLRALQAAAKDPPEALAELDLASHSLAALLYSASASLRQWPELASRWAARLARREGLGGPARVRCLAVAAGAGRRVGHALHARSLRDLLEHHAEARAYFRDLSYGLGWAMSRSWVLPIDRLREALILADAGAAAESAGEMEIAVLLDGMTDVRVLQDAAWLALEQAGNPALAARLARRALDWEPSQGELHYLLAVCQEEQADARATDRYREALARLPEGSETHRSAREALERLESEER